MAKKKQSKKVSKTVKKTVNKENKTKLKNKFTFNNFYKKILPVILILIVMTLAYYIRTGPVDMNSMDKRVEANIYSNIQNMISQQVNSQYPNLNDFDKQELIKQEYQKVLNTGKYQNYDIDELVQKNVENAKSAFKADNGQTYLNAIDPYHFMKYADLYDQNGYVGTELKDGKPYVDYKKAPIGVEGKEKREFNTFMINTMYNLNGVDYTSTDGEKIGAIFLLPVFFVMLTVIPIFLILNKYTNNLTSFLGSVLLISIGTYISRTIAGFVDTDAYNVFFPLMIIMFIIFAIFEKKLWLKLTYAGLAGIFQTLFLWAWGKGWYMFLFVTLALLGYIGYLLLSKLIKDKKINKEFFNNIKSIFYELLAFWGVSFVLIYLFEKQNIFSTIFNGVTGSIEKIASISVSNIWPNVFSSVAELNPASFNKIVSSVGGQFVFLIAMLGIVFLTIDYTKKYDWSKTANRILVLFSIFWFSLIIYFKFLVNFTANLKLLFLILLFIPIGVGLILSLLNQNNSNRIFLAILLSVWVAGTIYMSLNGIRFILLLAPAFAISFAVGLYYISKTINNFVQKEFKPKTSITKNITGFTIISIIFVIMYIPMFTQAININQNTMPNFDDAWYDSMYKIKNQSQEDAIITSWWDFGHFFAAISDRGVTFDGGSQTTPRSHWVGKLLMENDEEVSHDILKMLVCRGNEAFNTFYSQVGNDNSDAVKINKILYKTFGKENKTQILKNNKYYDLNQNQINEIIEYLDCEKPVENFLITSEDMVSKAGVWAHWGSWDFTKKYVHEKYDKLSAQQIANNIDENISLIKSYISELEEIDRISKAQDKNKEDLTNKWFADYPSYIPIQNRYEYSCKNSKNTTLVCQNGIQINVMSGQIISNQFQGVEFRNLYMPGQNNTLTTVPQNKDGNVDAVLIPSNNGVNILLAQAPLGGSLFTKLFYLDGVGTKYFEKFDDVRSATGVRVKVWKTKWELEEENNNQTNILTNSSSN